jgi:ABC-type multidrug transport system fused ATPase/permease subunit
VLKEGRVAEQGTHEELLQNPEGLYFNLVLAQSSDA